MRIQDKVRICLIGLSFLTLAAINHPVLGLSLVPVNQIRLNCGNSGPILVIGNLTDEDAHAVPGSAFSLQCPKEPANTLSTFNFSRIFLASDAHFSIIAGESGWLTICNLGPNFDAPFRTNVPYYITSPSTGTCNSTLGGQSGNGSLLFTAVSLPGPPPPTLKFPSSLSLYHIQVQGIKMQQLASTFNAVIPTPARFGITAIKTIRGNGEPTSIIFPKLLTDIGPGSSWSPPNRLRIMLVPPGPKQSCNFNDVPLTPIDPKSPGAGPWCMLIIPLNDRTAQVDRVTYQVELLVHYGYVSRTYTMTITVIHYPTTSTGSLSPREPGADTRIRITNSVLKTTEQAQIVADGTGIDSVQLEVFNLAGAKVLAARAAGPQLTFRAQDMHGQPLATGVYLYRVIARNLDGTVVSQEARKLVIVR